MFDSLFFNDTLFNDILDTTVISGQTFSQPNIATAKNDIIYMTAYNDTPIITLGSKTNEQAADEPIYL